MPSILDSVNQRTQMVGQNRLELLMFKLGSKQKYGINVFKVKEVLQCPSLTELPKRNPVVRGVAHIRGHTISVIDLSMAVGGGALTDINNCFIIIAEYNRTTQGFLVSSVERIVNMNWGEIHPPPKGSGSSSYLTAVTEVDSELVEIIDVEKVLSEVAPPKSWTEDTIVEKDESSVKEQYKILVVDDSAVARNQVKKTIESMGFEVVTKKNGREGLDFLLSISDEGREPSKEILLVISDIEMPEMDGYTLTAEVRGQPTLKNLYIMLHTSLSGVFNQAMVKRVGADDFLAKFSPDELATAVKSRIEAVQDN
ncbi:MAG: chemotaxis protein CheV [Pseudomonadota bacterium]